MSPESPSLLPTDTFARRHIGPTPDEIQSMLATLGYPTLDALIDATIPPAIRLKKPLNIGAPQAEHECLLALKALASQNKVHRSFIGMGYYGTITPPVILRNILENPGWYTQYTPYQAEISQGRLEALINFQTMVADLTGLPLANASLLDEATAAAEAMAMCVATADDDSRKTFFISTGCHPQTIAVVKSRAAAIGVQCIVADEQDLLAPIENQKSKIENLCGILLQYPATDGRILDYSPHIAAAKAAGVMSVVATDLLALTLIKPPGEFGADIAIGSAQRFGVPMGFGGPHAAFMATTPEHVRKMPGRIVGLSKDAAGNPAYRLALQTREQHIRRDKATSNICTAQVLLAIMASMYAVYHGPEGLKAIATRIAKLTGQLFAEFSDIGVRNVQGSGFDTLKVNIAGDGNSKYRDALRKISVSRAMNFRHDDSGVIISLDEASTESDVRDILSVFVDAAREAGVELVEYGLDLNSFFWKGLERTSPFLTHPVFNRYHSETEMLRYIKRLESRDLSLAQSMIPLGSCTMKLNATTEMIPVTWPEFGNIHPFAPADQTQGYQQLFTTLEKWLANITGFAAVSLQPNAGSQGEYAGLLVIRAYHESRGDTDRHICLIPTSAHGTNPASAVVAGFKVVAVACDAAGNVDIADLRAKAAEHKANLGALMVTYPSTHGVFEEAIRDICKIIHDAGGQVYMDGANMNAQVGLTSPGEIGADVCHLNLHKTFCIPHGGGGPGMGPIGVAQHLAPFLPSHPLCASVPQCLSASAIGPISAAPWGSASILPISYVYIAMMGSEGLKRATEVAILNANYIAKRLEGAYDVLFKGAHGRCAHECILECRNFEATANVKVEDICKRLMDYGFHAPTMSFPVPGTLMIEPTESESKYELDRFCDAMLAIREEIRTIETGQMDKKDNPLKNAPHTAAAVTATHWPHPYPRELAAYPAKWLKDFKFWPHVARIDNPYGDRNLICTCPPMTA